MQKKVSILIPLYNSEKWILNCVNSALNQSYEHIEVIVVDDGSTDSSWSIISALNYDNLIIYHQENKGASTARNKAFQLSSGEYIQYLDADDLLAPDKIEHQMNLLMNADPYVVSSCSYCSFIGSPSDSRFHSLVINRDYNNPLDWLIDSWNGKDWAANSSWLVPRKVIENAGPWNENLTLNDDGEFFSRVLINAREIKFSGKSLVYYRRGNPNSISNNQDYESLLMSYKLYKNHLSEFLHLRLVKKGLILNFQSLIYLTYPNRPEIYNEAIFQVKEIGTWVYPDSAGIGLKILTRLTNFLTAIKIRSFIVHRLGDIGLLKMILKNE